MFSWQRKRDEELDNQDFGCAQGGELPQRSKDEKKQYDQARAAGKAELNEKHRKRQQAECSEPGCGQDATNHDDDSSKGTCESHTGSWWSNFWG